MDKRAINGFLVDTNGHCFICLNTVVLIPDNKTNKSASSVSATPYSSLHSLSRYLKMDMSKVFHEKESIPSDLLDNVKRSKLKASLCEQCAKWNERILSLCRQLEKIETEVAFYLELIHGSLLRSYEDEDDKSGLLYNNLGEGCDSSNGGLLEKFRIVKALRTEAKQKCSDKLNATQPRVKVRNLTINQVFSIEQKTKSKSRRPVISTAKPDSDDEGWTNPGELDQIIIKHEQANEENDYSADNTDNEPQPIEEDTISGNEDERNDPVSVDLGQLTGSSLAEAQTDYQPLEFKKVAAKSSSKVVSSLKSIKNVARLTCEINTKTGKFKCNICSREFIQKAHLKRHYDSAHLKIKYKCNLCGKEFTVLSNYNTHHKIVHVGVRFKCNLCGKCFTKKHNLISHQSIQHGK